MTIGDKAEIKISLVTVNIYYRTIAVKETSGFL